MAWIDARVPVRFGAVGDAVAGDALLLEGDAVAPPEFAAARFVAASAEHAPGCACCVARSAAAVALNKLFQARARGTVPFFRRVLAVTASAEGEMEVWAAVRGDPLVSGRFRVE